MGKLLKEALTEVSELSEDQQETIGTPILAELESEHSWMELFDSSQDVLKRLGREALEEYQMLRRLR